MPFAIKKKIIKNKESREDSMKCMEKYELEVFIEKRIQILSDKIEIYFALPSSKQRVPVKKEVNSSLCLSALRMLKISKSLF
jgi:hypothetical protein